MESHNLESPMNTFTLDLGLSKECPKEMKNLLQQLTGVKSITIDPNEGKVTVIGDVNPMMLIKLLQKIGKKAQLKSFDKSPMQSRASSYRKHKKTSHCCCESDSEDDSDEDFISCGRTRHKTPRDQRSKKRHSKKYVAPPVVTEYHPPVPWYQPEPVPYAMPSIYITPMPWTWHGYYWLGQPIFPY